MKKRLSSCIVSVLLGISVAKAETVLLADSVRDFSNKQGQNNWFYGYYIAPFKSDNFEEMKEYDVETNAWYVAKDTYWTILGNNYGHPNAQGVYEKAQVEHWVARRWKSPISSKMTLSGTFAKSDIMCGDGSTVYIFVDGTQQLKTLIGFNHHIVVDYETEISVNEGSVIDFVISPGNQFNEKCDSTRFTAVITTNRDYTTCIECKPATLSFDFNMHIPRIHYFPLREDETEFMPLWVDLSITDLQKLQCKITDYGVVK